MTVLIKGYFVNRQSNTDNNKKFFLVFKRDLAKYLRDLDVNPDFKFDVMMKVGELDDHLHLDPMSFRDLVFNVMLKIKKEICNENKEKETLLNFIDECVEKVKI